MDAYENIIEQLRLTNVVLAATAVEAYNMAAIDHIDVFCKFLVTCWQFGPCSKDNKRIDGYSIHDCAPHMTAGQFNTIMLACSVSIRAAIVRLGHVASASPNPGKLTYRVDFHRPQARQAPVVAQAVPQVNNAAAPGVQANDGADNVDPAVVAQNAALANAAALEALRLELAAAQQAGNEVAAAAIPVRIEAHVAANPVVA